MYIKEDIKKKAILLRKRGKSLGEIKKLLKIPKTTVHLWTKDIILSEIQKKQIFLNANKKLQLAREKSQKSKLKLNLNEEINLIRLSKNQTTNLSKRDLFIAGIALYWGQGFKNIHERRLGFCNSDPKMIIFYIKWLKSVFNINDNGLIPRLSLNIKFKDKEDDIVNYWIGLTKIPKPNFSKTFFQNVKWQKTYANDNYKGVLRIHAKNSKAYLFKVKGWIEGFKNAKIEK